MLQRESVVVFCLPERVMRHPCSSRLTMLVMVSQWAFQQRLAAISRTRPSAPKISASTMAPRRPV